MLHRCFGRQRVSRHTCVHGSVELFHELRFIWARIHPWSLGSHVWDCGTRGVVHGRPPYLKFFDSLSVGRPAGVGTYTCASNFAGQPRWCGQPRIARPAQRFACVGSIVWASSFVYIFQPTFRSYPLEFRSGTRPCGQLSHDSSRCGRSHVDHQPDALGTFAWAGSFALIFQPYISACPPLESWLVHAGVGGLALTDQPDTSAFSFGRLDCESQTYR